MDSTHLALTYVAEHCGWLRRNLNSSENSERNKRYIYNRGIMFKMTNPGLEVLDRLTVKWASDN